MPSRDGRSQTLAFNPSREKDGWRAVVMPHETDHEVLVGASGCATDFRDEFVIASGRPEEYAKKTAAFKFTGPLEDPFSWHHGQWRSLPDLCKARVGGALFVVEGKLYISGGVDEQTSEFCKTFERLDDHLSPPCWTIVPWVEMPRPLHAHTCLSLPTLVGSKGQCPTAANRSRVEMPRVRCPERGVK